MVFLRRQPEPVHAFNEQQHTVAPVSPEIATLAATSGVRHKLAMADARIYATALSHHATLWTQDDDFEDLPNVRYFPKIKL